MFILVELIDGVALDDDDFFVVVVVVVIVIIDS